MHPTIGALGYIPDVTDVQNAIEYIVGKKETRFTMGQLS